MDIWVILKSFKKITKQKTVYISLTGRNISYNDYEYIMKYYHNL